VIAQCKGWAQHDQHQAVKLVKPWSTGTTLDQSRKTKFFTVLNVISFREGLVLATNLQLPYITI
jgi:hypothetical protein